ncbi:MAG: T9SS type A sorting domain-containing protein, partial [bacterium]
YRVLEGADSIWFELPWEVYYNYIVHPIISDEFPDMSAYVYSQFWREYLFYVSDVGYPKLGEKIKDAKILWDGIRVILPPGRPFTPNDCALDVIANWATCTVPVAAQGNRPIQPNIIAHEHNGNCGELQDLLTAGARTCLVPCVGTSDPCEDHVWSEFYDRGFYPYQVDLGFGVTHIADTNVAYDEQYGGSKRVSAIFDWRSDGYWWTVTGTYSNSCSLYVYVCDLMGRPIDGAGVTISSEGYYGGFSTSTRAYTDPDGHCCFELGDLRNFYARVSTPIGSYPPNPEEIVQIIQNSQSGANYYKVFYVADYLPAPVFSDTASLNSLSVWKFEVVLDSIEGQSSGSCITRFGPGDSIRVYRSFHERYAKGNIDLLFVDDANLNRYIQGEPFKAFDFCSISRDTASFIAQDSAVYHLIVSNEDVLYNTPFCNLKVNLYRNPAPGVEEETIKKALVQKLPTIYKGRLFLNLNEPSQIKVYEASGRLVYESQKKVDKMEKFLSAGVYFIRITKDDENQTGKFVIVK